MKKALVILLALSMVACMFACAPAAEAPAAEAPVAEEPTAQEPAAQEPAAQEPAAEEPVAQEPAAEEPAGDVTLAFNVKNKYKSAGGESLQMTELYLYVKGSEEKGENLLSGVPQINSSEYSDYVRIVCVRPAATDYEAYAVFANADGSITEEGAFKNLQMMDKNSLSFKGEGEVSCKADEDVSFTDELLADALADGSAFKALATIAFTLKNKTDVTINELYVYPTGAADKGSNILEAPMISSGEDADYLHPVIMRERVATYDVTVVLEDGTEFSIPGLDMDNATKLSLKAADGSDFSIDTILTLEEEGDQEGIDEFYGYFTEDLVKPLQNAMVSCH